ncbi:MAG: 16S rRNA (cytosine(1402)-N(4))-methyltransferase RsmH [Oscillospiraceae bacterium]|nr:16S rRNA (cytosine(1402)-N(4))-methyltransferase RsmH [Oscillospiraceae bacterium]
MDFNHYPVMKNEAVEYLNINPDGFYVDATLGGGSHSLEIVKKLDKGRLIAIDRDIDAVKHSEEKLKDFIEKDKICIVKDNYVNIKDIVKSCGYEKINGVLVDMGLSFYQIEADRGFSYIKDSALDMRMDRDQKLTAFEVVNTFEKDALRDILYNCGEERYTDMIVREILKRRENKKIETTSELADIAKYAVRNVKYDGGHPAKRLFQALRIFINEEIVNIEPTIDAIEQILEKSGRCVCITFHSLEDRAVKKSFAKYEKGCVCPPDFPVCVCGKKPTIKLITRKPLYPSATEIGENPSSASAKMRVMEKL